MNIDTFYDIFRYTKMTASPDQAVVDVATDTIVEQQQQPQTQEQHLGLTSGEQTQESATAESASPVKTEKKTCSTSNSKSDVKHDNGREKGDCRREKGDSGKRLEFSRRESRSLDAQSKSTKEHKNSKTRRGPLVKSKSEESRNDNGLRRQGSRESDAQPRRSSGNKKLVRSKAFDKDTYEISSQVSDVPPRLKMKADSSDYPSPRIVRQHSGTRSEPALSRDSSMDDQSHRPIDSTGTDVLQFIIKALQTQKDRKHLLDFEHDVLEFLDSGEEEKKFPPMNSYQRMLLHRVAVLFGLEHNVDDTKSYVILNKTQHMRRPDQKFQDYIKDDPVPTTILKRIDPTADYSSMGRPFDKDLNKQNKSFEERKENYEELRHKLFSGDKEAQEVPTIQRPNRLLVNSSRRQDSGTSDESMRSYFEDRPWSSVESSGSERQHPAHIIKASSFAGVTNRNSFNRKDSSSSWSSSGSSNRGSLSKLARVDSSEQRTGSPQYRPPPQFPVFNQQFISQPGHQITYQPVQPMAQVSSWQHNNITGQPQMPANSGMITPGNISSPTILYSAPSIESVPAGSILYNPHTGSPYQNQDGTPLVYHPGMSSQVTANQPITNQNLQQVQLHQQIVNQGQMQQSLPTAAPMNINQLQNQQHLNQQITAPGQHIPSQVYGTQPVLLHQLPHQTSGEYPDVTVQLQTMNINRQPSNESDPNQQQQQQQQVLQQQQMVGQVVRHPGVMSGFQVQGTGTPGGAPTQQQQPPQVLFCPPNQNQPQVTQTQITYQVPAQFVQQQQGLTMQPLTPAQISSQHQQQQQQQQQQQAHQPTAPVIYQTQPQLLGQQQQPMPTQGGYQHIPISNLHHQQQQQQQQQILYQPVYDPQASHPQGFGSNLQIVYQTTPNATQLQTHSVQDVHRSTSPGSQILAAPIVSQVQAQTPMAYVHMHQQHRPQSPHSGSQYSSHSVQGSKSPSPQQAVMQYQQRITPGSDIRSPRPPLYVEQHSTLSPSMSPTQSPSPSRADSLEKGVTGRQRHSATLHSGQGSQEDSSQDDLNVLYVVGIPVDATVMEAESMLHEVVNLGAQITWTKRNSGLPGIADRNDKATEYTIRALLPTAEHAQRVHRSISSTNYQLLLHKTDSGTNAANL